ncbi:MAG: hypothetical protein F6K16_34985, partial [Symploca sp. SIO2B6]|nr:hypothetical protein [Symploca sp. SIO2B6]
RLTRYGISELLTAEKEVSNRSDRFTGEQFDVDLGDYYLRDRFYDQSSGRFLRKDVYEGNTGQPLSLHKYMYVHADPVNGTDPSGFLRLQEQVLVMNEMTRLVTTGYILYLADPINSLLSMGARQINALVQARRGHHIPHMKRDENGCFSRNYPRPRPDEDWAKYETQVSNSNMNFIAVTPEGQMADFDGFEEPRTVWEAKYGNDWLVSLIPSDKVILGQIERWDAVDKQKNRQVLVAERCKYNLRWAFSDYDLFDEANYRWTRISPPKPDTNHIIPDF